MVSIFADTPIDDNRTLSTTQGQDWDSTNISFQESSILDGFTYLERIEFDFDNSPFYRVTNNEDSTITMGINIIIEFLSNGVAVDTITKTESSNVGTGNRQINPFDINDTIAFDSYADSSLVLNVTYDYFSTGSAIFRTSNPTRDYELDLQVKAIGRTV